SNAPPRLITASKIAVSSCESMRCPSAATMAEAPGTGAMLVQRAHVGDDVRGVLLRHVKARHGRFQLHAVTADGALRQQPHRLLVVVSGQAPVSRRGDRPVVRPWRPERDGRAVELPGFEDVTFVVTGRMTLYAHRDLMDDVAAVFEIAADPLRRGV